MFARSIRLWLPIAVVLLILASGDAFAQEDTTPPVLLDFAISPVVFDTGLGPVDITWCTTARDDLAGLDDATLFAKGVASGHGLIGSSANFQTDETDPLRGVACETKTLPQFSPYDTYALTVTLHDIIPNSSSPPLSTCGFGPCELVNRPEFGLPDSDDDGEPDDSDNCPDDANEDQADADLDLIGDACDPYPDDRDNEQAQCDEDLDVCQAQQVFQDTDWDGEEDSTDACPNTPSGEAVDQAGCSLGQFCSSIDTSINAGNAICGASDWGNDEPLSRPFDCRAVDGLCVAM